MKSASTRDTRLELRMGDKDTKHRVPGCYSQSDEDIIIKRIFKEIGTTNKRFFEFGSGDGRQNNTIALILSGWSGTWCEPHGRRYLSAKRRCRRYPVVVRRRVITPEKVNVAINEPLDFLSIDVDGNDYAIWKALTCKPRVVCIELVGKPETSLHYGGWYAQNTSLDMMTALAESKGYRFYCTSASKINAFYILR
jgi:hypothetical protein